jgi:hypothetical protein
MRAKIFSVVNGVMKGRWAETAMQETGSIICQNIFESADVGEKVSRGGKRTRRPGLIDNAFSPLGGLRVGDSRTTLRVRC